MYRSWELLLMCAAALMVSLAAASLQAALFSGPSGFTLGPSSQMGTVTNNLVLTDNPNGFVVSGQLLVNIPGGSSSGLLASWTIERPLDATYGTGNLVTTTVLDGFSLPVPGPGSLNTNGQVLSDFTSYPGVSQSSIPITLVNGAATWTNLTASSSTFSYTSGGVEFLRQRFELDGIYNGPGGIWTLDVPVITAAEAVPEPAAVVLGLLGFAGTGLVCFARRKK